MFKNIQLEQFIINKVQTCHGKSTFITKEVSACRVNETLQVIRSWCSIIQCTQPKQNRTLTLNTTRPQYYHISVSNSYQILFTFFFHELLVKNLPHNLRNNGHFITLPRIASLQKIGIYWRLHRRHEAERLNKAESCQY